MTLFDGKGNSVEITARLPSVLNGADVIFWGDSNVYYSAGRTFADIGSFYQRLALEFNIGSWMNKGSNGRNTYQLSLSFAEWAAVDENVELYNKESTIMLFWCGTNDYLEWWTGTTATGAVADISAIIREKFPKVQYHWIIPPATDWSKWTGSNDADVRNMAEKVPLMIQTLESNLFPCLDIYHKSGITPEMLSDGVHLGGGDADYTTDAVYRAYRTLREYLMNK